MVPFAGYEMPLEYAGITQEHLNVRQNVGVFDVSHMGEFWARGPKAFDLVQAATTNDVAKLKDGQAQYTCLPNGKGGIVDDLLVYRFGPEDYLLVVNAANIEKDWKWLAGLNAHIGAELDNASDRIAQLAVQGPRATELLQTLTAADLSAIPYYHFTMAEVAGIPEVLVSATGYTGAGGFELYVDNARAAELWDALFEAGKPFGLQPAGLAARDTLRLEMGFCLYGNDIDETTSPMEAGLGWITKFSPGNDFIDRERLERQKAEGTRRQLRGLEMVDKGIPRRGYPVLSPDGKPIGQLTSGTQSPMLKIGIALGYVETEYAQLGTEVLVEIRGKRLKAKVVKLPFWKA